MCLSELKAHLTWEEQGRAPANPGEGSGTQEVTGDRSKAYRLTPGPPFEDCKCRRVLWGKAVHIFHPSCVWQNSPLPTQKEERRFPSGPAKNDSSRRKKSRTGMQCSTRGLLLWGARAGGLEFFLTWGHCFKVEFPNYCRMRWDCWKPHPGNQIQSLPKTG